MIEKEVVILNEKGLKSRAVSMLVKKAMQFKSNITITYNGKKADAKSLINVFALKIPAGGAITISASGDDEVFAVEELTKLVTSLG